MAPLAVWITGAFAYWAAVLWVRLFHPQWLFDGFKIRPDSSDSAWQTIRLWEMWKLGPRTLWDMHVYPPLYDGLRFLLMQPETLAGQSPSALAVDQRLYVVNSILFGLVAMIVYLWVRDLTGSSRWGIAGAVLWSVVPASLAYMSLLSQPGPAIAAMAVAFYLLYRFCRTRRYAYAAGFLGALLVASLTRNVVQIHVLIILVIAAVALWVMTWQRRAWMLAVNLALVALLALWPTRAYVLYATFDVSTHTGYNRAGALWINPESVPELVPTSVKQQYDELAATRKAVEDPTALVTLSPTEVQDLRSKLTQLESEWIPVQERFPGVDFSTVGTYPDRLINNSLRLSSGWNTQELLLGNYRLGEAANSFIVQHPTEALGAAIRSLSITVPTIFRSVSVQWYNGFSYTFPLSPPLDWIFSSWRFALLIGVALSVIVAHFGLKGTWRRVIRYGWFAVFWLLTAVPVLLSNRYWPPEIPEPTHSEADRLRALVDVPIYVLMTFAAYLAWQWIRRRKTSHRDSRGLESPVPSGKGGPNPEGSDGHKSLPQRAS